MTKKGFLWLSVVVFCLCAFGLFQYLLSPVRIQSISLNAAVIYGQFQSKPVSDQFEEPILSGQNHSHRLPPSFELHDPFHLPQPLATKSTEALLQTEWMKELKEYLKGVQSPDPVALVTSDYTYREVLLNWIVMAIAALDSPINNLLVISINVRVHKLLKSRNISSIYFETSPYLGEKIKFDSEAMVKAMVIRLTVMRFLNNWGYDIVNYDTDALVIRNPIPIFEQYKEADIIVSYGNGWPNEIFKEWGFTLCMGVIMIRSSPKSELFWETFAHTAPNTYDDQVKLNFALQSLGLRFKGHAINNKWSNRLSNIQSIKKDFKVLEGEGRDGLSVIVLPASIVCRGTDCNSRVTNTSQYYIWHQGGIKDGKVKSKTAIAAGLWYLKEDWEKINGDTTVTGKAWLKAIAIF